jgi:tRNA (guanine37-N1)-methyltransferase
LGEIPIIWYNKGMKFHVVTLFPEAFESYLGSSIIGRAIREKKIKVRFYNPRDFTKDKWKKRKLLSVSSGAASATSDAEQREAARRWVRVDQRPYGGGPGMVLEAESILKAAEAALRKVQSSKSRVMSKAKNSKPGTQNSAVVYFFDRSGKQFTNTDARKLANTSIYGGLDVVLICGHYEGVDARVQKILKAKKISVGPYTLTGGELPAMAVIDAVSRQIPGVLGKFESVEEERISSSEVYTRPEILTWKGKKYRVPKVLLSGHHKNIEAWKTRRTNDRPSK